MSETWLQRRPQRWGGEPPPFDTSTISTFRFGFNGLSVDRHFFDTFDTSAFCSPFSPSSVASVAIVSKLLFRHSISSFLNIYIEKRQVSKVSKGITPFEGVCARAFRAILERKTGGRSVGAKAAGVEAKTARVEAKTRRVRKVIDLFTVRPCDARRCEAMSGDVRQG